MTRSEAASPAPAPTEGPGSSGVGHSPAHDRSSKPHTSGIERLRRWQNAGGIWQVLRRTEQDVTVSLCRCDGGEEADRLTSDEADLLAYLDGRDSSEGL